MERRIMFMYASFAFLLAGTVTAQLLVENFDYPAGNSLSAHGWTLVAGGGANIVIATPGLEYPGYPLSGLGNAALMPRTSDQLMKPFPAQSGGSVYASFLVKVHDAENSPGMTPVFLGPAGTSIFNRKCSFYVERIDTLIGFGILKENGAMYTQTVYPLETIFLIVMKYEFKTGSATDDLLSLWVNPPTDGTIPAANESISDGNDAGSLQEIVIGTGYYSSQQTMTVDGLEISTSWPLGGTGFPDRGTQGMPETVALAQNHPNPFNSSTVICYTLPEPQHVSLTLSDPLGRTVASLVEGDQDAGEHSVYWSGKDFPSGVYFFSLRAGETVLTRKLLLLK